LLIAVLGALVPHT